jgi:type IV secretion system protein VirD4
MTPIGAGRPKPKARHLALALILGLLLANAAATQYAAASLAYHPALGSPIAGHIYAPWEWLVWQHKFASHAPHVFRTVTAAIALVLACGLFALLASNGRNAQRHEGIHGTAHWASREEIEATGLLPRKGRKGEGVYVGGWRDDRQRLHYLRHNGPEHIAAIAPTRSGKGIGLVVPTLLSWPHSVVVNDQKAELWNLTAAWRREEAGNVVMKFDPGAAEGSAGFNPLEEIRLGTIHEVGDVQNLVTILVDPDGKGLADHWAKTSHAFLTGAVLHVLYKKRAEGRVGCLPDVAGSLSDPDQRIENLYVEMIANSWAEGGKTHPTIASAARDMMNRPGEERGSVLSTAMSFLSLYRDPLVARNVARSDFKVSDLMNHGTPVTLYLVVRAEDKDRMRPLMRLIVNQVVRVLLRPEITFVEGRPKPPHKHKLLLMLDEFPSYGKLEVFQEALAYIAGYGIKAYLIMQDMSQLWAAYGKDESITSNCHVRIAYAPNRVETAEWLSRMLGTATIVKQDITESGKRYGAVLTQVAQHYSQVSRALLTADEIMRLRSPQKNADDLIAEPGDMLIFVAGHAPVFGTQSLYFLNPVFAKRARLPVPQTDSLHHDQATAFEWQTNPPAPNASGGQP